MNKKKYRFLYFAPPVAGLILAAHVLSVSAAGYDPNSANVAIASVERQHTHSLVLQPKDVADLIASLGDGETANIESSAGYDGGAVTGALHSHNVPLKKSDLQTLQASGTAVVQSDTSNGHQHAFTFIMQKDCPSVAVPLPTGTPSVRPSPSPSARPSASPSPSSSPSASPSPSPTPSATPSPTPIPTPSPSLQPQPSPTPTLSPFPFPTFPTIPFPF